MFGISYFLFRMCGVLNKNDGGSAAGINIQSSFSKYKLNNSVEPVKVYLKIFVWRFNLNYTAYLGNSQKVYHKQIKIYIAFLFLSAQIPPGK